jgi:RimJ/RimL family protein N-acetyltransferase
MEFRIQLKLPVKEDLEYIRWLWSDPDTMEAVGEPVLLTDEEADWWYAYMVDPGRPTECYRLILNEEGYPIGEVSFHRYDLKTRAAMFNLKIVNSERSKGYGREAMLLFLDYFFNGLGGCKMLDELALNNLRGQQVLLRFGFVHDPGQRDNFSVSITRKQFNSIYAS